MLVSPEGGKVQQMLKKSFFFLNLLLEQSKYVRAGRSAKGEPSLSKEQWVTVREVSAGQGTVEREGARRSSRETEQWSTDKDRSETCKDAKSPTNCTENGIYT